MQTQIGTSILELIQGDITAQETEAIVNAANSSLLGGGGVDGAIHRAGGPAILAECKTLGGCETGNAKITTAGNLPAQYVIHAVGPIYRGGASGESALLASCYRRCLEIALENNVKSIAFPSISTGAYQYPVGEAALIALRTVKHFLEANPQIQLARFALFDPNALEAYKSALQEIEA